MAQPVHEGVDGERKWLGLGFAFSHATHLVGIIALASPDVGAFVRARAPTTAVAALTFVVLFAMAFTSINRVRKAMNPRTWKRLHRTGMHLSWISFTSTYVASISVSPVYALRAPLLWYRGDPCRGVGARPCERRIVVNERVRAWVWTWGRRLWPNGRRLFECEHA